MWDNLKQEQEEEQKIKSSMKRSVTQLKYMCVPEDENIQLEYYKSFICETEILILYVLIFL